jgi:hypothetical protein
LSQIVCITPTPAAMVGRDKEIIKAAFGVGNRRLIIKNREGRLIVFIGVSIAICFDLLLDDIERVIWE